MSNLQVIENSEKYFIEKKEEVNAIILLPTRSFLQKSFDFEKIFTLLYYSVLFISVQIKAHIVGIKFTLYRVSLTNLSILFPFLLKFIEL